MGLHKLAAGSGYTYLTRQVAAQDASNRGPRSLAAYYSAKGESPGRWVGAGLAGLGMQPGEQVTGTQMLALFGEGRHPVDGNALGRPYRVYDATPAGLRAAVTEAYRQHNLDQHRAAGAPIPAEERARVRTEVARRLFTQRHGSAPRDARELGGFVARESRPPQTAVAGFDLTFSPVKSVSVLWALAPLEVAKVVQAAHDAAVADTLAWLEREVAFTRTGIGAVRQVPVVGLVAAAFTHRDSRAGDPDLHTHVAVSNKVQTRTEGGDRWLALDARVLYKAKVAASERYNTRLEAELVERLGVRFADRPSYSSKRPVREIEGISAHLIKRWSSRRAAIEVRRAQLAVGFQQDHGRPPTAVEALALAQQATLETRQAKHEPRAEPDQRAEWRRDASAFLGADEVDEMVRVAVGHAPTELSGGDEWVASAACRVVATVEESRATWQVWHVRAEAERQARAAAVPLASLDATVAGWSTERCPWSPSGSVIRTRSPSPRGCVGRTGRRCTTCTAPPRTPPSESCAPNESSSTPRS